MLVVSIAKIVEARANAAGKQRVHQHRAIGASGPQSARADEERSDGNRSQRRSEE